MTPGRSNTETSLSADVPRASTPKPLPLTSATNENPTEPTPPHPTSAQRSNSTRVFNALEKLRSRLDAIDEHSRELRKARHIILKREETLAKERRELIDFLRLTEPITSTSLTEGGMSEKDHDVAEVGFVGEDDELAFEFEPPSKRRAVDRSAATSPTESQLAPSALAQDCPAEFQRRSTTPPRRSQDSAHLRTPHTSPNSKSGVRHNGIRFPPGSAPRPPRTPQTRCSSPFTQMLPPPLPLSNTTAANIATPKPTRVHQPLTPKSASSAAHTPNDAVIPAGLFIRGNPILSWDVAYLGPERTPSPPIGKWKKDGRQCPEGSEKPVSETKVGIEATVVTGPASRTRARMGSIGKGRV